MKEVFCSSVLEYVQVSKDLIHHNQLSAEGQMLKPHSGKALLRPMHNRFIQGVTCSRLQCKWVSRYGHAWVLNVRMLRLVRFRNVVTSPEIRGTGERLKICILYVEPQQTTTAVVLRRNPKDNKRTPQTYGGQYPNITTLCQPCSS